MEQRWHGWQPEGDRTVRTPLQKSFHITLQRASVPLTETEVCSAVQQYFINDINQQRRELLRPAMACTMPANTAASGSSFRNSSAVQARSTPQQVTASAVESRGQP